MTDINFGNAVMQSLKFETPNLEKLNTKMEKEELPLKRVP